MIFRRVAPLEEPWAGDQVAPTGLRRKRKHSKANLGGAGWAPGGWLAGEAQPMPAVSTAGQLRKQEELLEAAPQGQALASGGRFLQLLRLPALAWSPELR